MNPIITVALDPYRHYTFRADAEALFDPGPYGNLTCKATTTREQAERFFARESAVNAAARLRYSNREHAKFMIDNLIEDGYTLAAGMRGCVKTVCLVGPAGQNIELRRKAEIDYVRVVTNTGNMARNY